jgi:hypothetical protein
MPLADRARSLFSSVPSLPSVSVPYPSSLIRKAGFGGTSGGSGKNSAFGGGGQPNGDVVVDATTGTGGAFATAGGVRADAGEGEIQPAVEAEMHGDTTAGGRRSGVRKDDGGTSSSGVLSATIKAAAATEGGKDDNEEEDDGNASSGDDVAFTLAAVRTSLDAREMAAMAQGLDALEEIPTLSLEDFLRPAFMNANGASSSSGHGSDNGGNSVPSSQPDTPRPRTPPSSHYDADTDLEVFEEVDPRVSGALDELNDSMTDVNALETELSAARRRRQGACFFFHTLGPDSRQKSKKTTPHLSISPPV